MSFGVAHQSKNKIKDSKTSISAKHPSSTPHYQITNLSEGSPDYFLHLQQMMGNQTVQRLVRSKNNNAATGFDFAKVSIFQPKLKVSQPRDEYEQEAGRVAEQVTTLSSLDPVVPMATIQEERIDRESTVSEMKEDENKELSISLKPSTMLDLEATDKTANEINDIRSSGGSSLDANTKEFMETRFGYDFSDVRIHADTKAAKSANSVNALAYTVGNDVVFGPGLYQPNTLEGRKLLVHELAHVVQQNNTIYRDVLDAGVPLPAGVPLTEEEIRRQHLLFTPISDLSDEDLGPALDLAQEERDDSRHSSVLFELVRRLDSDQHTIFGTALPRTIPRGSGGTALVTPDIGMEMIENMLEGRPPFRPDLGRGGASSWFVTEGSPATGVSSQHTVPTQVELVDTANAIQYRQPDLDRIFGEEEARARPEVESQVRERFRIRTGRDAPEVLSNSLRNKIARQLRQLAERRMWERIGNEVAASSNKVGKVTLPPGGRFSPTAGVFTVIADAAKIRLRGGIMPLIDALIRSGAVEIPPGLTAEAAKMARSMNAAGRVRAVFRIGGKVLIVIGIGASIVDIITADDKLEAVLVNAAGWAGAIAAGSAFAAWFTPADAAGPWAWLAHGVGTVVAGGIGFAIGSETTRYVYRLVVRKHRRFTIE